MEASTTQPVARRWWTQPIVWVVALAFVLRLVSIGVDADRIHWVNERLFAVPAAHLVQGQGLTQADGLATAYRPPLYVFWLAGAYAVFGPYAEIGPAVLQAALGALNVLLLFLIGLRLWKRRDAALAGAILLTVHPYAVWHDVAVSYTVLAVTVSLLFVWTLLRAMEKPIPMRAFLIGVAAAFAVLLMTTVVPVLGLIGLVALLCWRVAVMKRVAILAVAVAGFLLVWGPWAVRNAIVFHAFVPTTTETGLTLWYGNNDEAPWRIPHFLHEDTPVPAGTPVAHDNVTGCAGACVQAASEVEENAAFAAMAVTWMKAYPADFVTLSLWRLGRIWSPFLVPAKNITGQAMLDAMVTWVYAAWTVLIYVLGIVGLWRLWEKNRWTAAMLFVWIVIPASLYAISLHFTRYRIPFEAVLLALAGGGLVVAIRAAKGWRALQR